MIISSTISWQEQFAFRCNDDVCFILYKHAMFYLQSASSLMQQCALDMSLHSDTQYPDSDLTNLWSYSLLVRALRRSSNYQFYSLQIGLAGTFTHDLPHSRRTRLPLQVFKQYREKGTK